MDIVKGTGILERTPIFIGWYPAHLSQSPPSYLIHLAYTLTFLFAFIVSICFVVRAYGNWLKKKITFFDFEHAFSNIIFTGWDFHISDSGAAETAKKCIVIELHAHHNELKFLAERQNRTAFDQNVLWLKRLLIQLIIIALLLASYITIFLVVTRVKGTSFLQQYAATITVSAFVKIYPFIFEFLVKFEKYSDQAELISSIFRNSCLRIVSLLILVLAEISNKLQEDEDTVCHDENPCWETRVAQRIYSLAIFETLFHVPDIIITFIRCFLSRTSEEFFLARWLPKSIWTFIISPEFNSSQEVLKIVYLQTLCWMGMLCCPLLPLIIALALIMIICSNAAVLFIGKLKPQTIFRASRSSSMFMIDLFIGLVFSLIPNLLILWELEPSLGCGPFRGIHEIYDAVLFSLCSGPPWIL